MMEFFISKIWAFVVGAVLLGVLLQGVTMHAQAERSAMLQDLAEGLQDLFSSVEDAGPGMERTIEMSEILPASIELTVFDDHATLEDNGKERVFSISLHRSLMKGPAGQLEEICSIKLDDRSVITLLTEDIGLTMIVLNPRTSPPGT